MIGVAEWLYYNEAEGCDYIVQTHTAKMNAVKTNTIQSIFCTFPFNGCNVFVNHLGVIICRLKGKTQAATQDMSMLVYII